MDLGKTDGRDCTAIINRFWMCHGNRALKKGPLCPKAGGGN
jgi:hypothetical protein